MKKIILITVLLGSLYSCKKKDSYGYTCRCSDQISNNDTIFTLRTATSGEAYYNCKDYQDTANKYGANYNCEID